ncbi:STAS domain-containing protein [Nocardioides sp. GXQ0305]|uniref:STAS domain-containing protein n=1 Tax=Nocardioides sp. GXQ0305 TaxID=3423912 RepID=UPI003D7DF97C
MGEVYLCTRARPDAVDIDVVGALTSRTARQVRAALSPYRSMVSRLRLRGCTDVDLDGVFALHAAKMEAREAGGEIQLLEVPPLIERYLHHHDGAHLLAPPHLPEDGASTRAEDERADPRRE